MISGELNEPQTEFKTILCIETSPTLFQIILAFCHEGQVYSFKAVTLTMYPGWPVMRSGIFKHFACQNTEYLD